MAAQRWEGAEIGPPCERWYTAARAGRPLSKRRGRPKRMNDEMSHQTACRGVKLTSHPTHRAEFAGIRARCAHGTSIAGAGAVIRLSLALSLLLVAPTAFAQTTFTVSELTWKNGDATMTVGGTNTVDEYLVSKAECYEMLEFGTLPEQCDPDATESTGSVSTTTITLSGTFSDPKTGSVSIWVGDCADSEPVVIEVDANGDGCTEVLGTTTVDDASTETSYIFDTVELFGTDCSTDSVEVLFYYTDGTTVGRAERLKIELDATAPTAPILTKADPGEGNVDLAWDAVTDSDVEDYIVFYGTGTFTSDSSVATETAGSTSTSVKVSGLSNDLPYNFNIIAVDEAGNSSFFCDQENTKSATPIEVFDGWEYYRENGGTEEGGYCYVATAAWNSPLAPAVTWLRGYRDARMLTNDGGRALVDLYNVVGPEAAALISGQPWLQNLVRWLLVPMILCAVLFAGWPVWGPLFGGALALLYRRRRKSAQKEGASS
ncbi:MAG: hypothetical protein ACI9OJ_003396 [Myxococcota bacterium]|jgi:hypothetical protein